MAKKKAKTKAKKRVAKKKPGGTPEQTVKEKVNELLGLQEETSSYFTADVEKDPFGWLKQFRRFLHDTAFYLDLIAGFDQEIEYEIARNIDNPDWARSGYGEFSRRHIKRSQVEIEASANPLTESEDLRKRCDLIYTSQASNLKHIRWFLLEVNELSGQVRDCPDLSPVLPQIREALSILGISFLEGLQWLYDTIEVRESKTLSLAESLARQLLLTSVFGESVTEHKCHRRLSELAITLGSPGFFGASAGGEDFKEMLADIGQHVKELSEIKQLPERLQALGPIKLREFIKTACGITSRSQLNDICAKLARKKCLPEAEGGLSRGQTKRFNRWTLFNWWKNNWQEYELPPIVQQKAIPDERAIPSS